MSFPPFRTRSYLPSLARSLHPHSTLLACQLTSRAFREFSNTVLYRHLQLSWTASTGLALLATLDENPSLAYLVVSTKVDFPRFEDLADVERRHERRIARVWAKEERTWPERLEQINPNGNAEVEQHFRGLWVRKLRAKRMGMDDAIYDKVDNDAWRHLKRNGNTRWLDHPRGNDGLEGRWVGAARLADLLASLPNLRRLDYTSYAGSLPPLPQLEYLSIDNGTSLCEPVIPDSPNLEELVLKGDFRLPSESPAQLRLIKLHTLRIEIKRPKLLFELLERSCATLRTLEIIVDCPNVKATRIVDFFSTKLGTLCGLESLSIHRMSNLSESMEDAPTFTSYVANSSLRHLAIPFPPSLTTFSSLPTTIESVQLLGKVKSEHVVGFLHHFTAEKARLPLLASIDFFWDGEQVADEAQTLVGKRVKQWTLLGVRIGVK